MLITNVDTLLIVRTRVKHEVYYLKLNVLIGISTQTN